MKKLMCVISQPPYANSHVLELLETAMVAAVLGALLLLPRLIILFKPLGPEAGNAVS